MILALLYKNQGNTGNNNGPYLTGTRYIMLDFPDVIYAGGINKTYLTLKSTKEVSDEELYRISKNIVIDKTKGEYANDGKESSLVTDNSNLIFNFDKVIVNLSNTVITKWISYGDGAMGIATWVDTNLIQPLKTGISTGIASIPILSDVLALLG